MRLSKNVKEVILNNWKSKKHGNIEAKLKDSLSSKLRKLFEEEYKKEFDIVAKNQDIKDYLNTHSYFKCSETYGLGFMNTEVISCNKYASKTRYDQCYLTNTKQSKNAISSHIEKYKEYKEEESIIKNIMTSVTTVKKLVDILPEIEKYIPKTSSSTVLIAAGDLVKAKSIL